MKNIVYLSQTDRVQTSATGTAFVPLGDRAADEVTVINKAGTAIVLKTSNTTQGVPLSDNERITIGISANISEISVKRADDSGTQVFVHFVSTRYVTRR